MSSTPVAKAKMQKAKSSLNMRVTPPAAVLAVANQLCEMAAQGDMAAVRKLVESGADVNAVDYDFRSCLHIAAANGHADLCEWLCANGALQVRPLAPPLHLRLWARASAAAFAFALLARARCAARSRCVCSPPPPAARSGVAVLDGVHAAARKGAQGATA